MESNKKNHQENLDSFYKTLDLYQDNDEDSLSSNNDDIFEGDKELYSALLTHTNKVPNNDYHMSKNISITRKCGFYLSSELINTELQPHHADEFLNDILDTSINSIIIEPGLEICNTTLLNNPEKIINTTFTYIEPEKYHPNITENLLIEISSIDDIENENQILLNEIKYYAKKINCSDFHGKGTIEDYSELFKVASKIANESKQIQLDIDIEGFNEFSQAAEDLSNLFENFTLRLQKITIINDKIFLTSIVNALKKIWKLSETFGKFKTTILSTTTIQFPKTAHETALVLNDVMSKINCAMNYITYFVSPTEESLPASELSVEEKNIISKALDTIQNWNNVCEDDISLAMNNNDDVKAIENYNKNIKISANILRRATNKLRTKLNTYMFT